MSKSPEHIITISVATHLQSSQIHRLLADMTRVEGGYEVVDREAHDVVEGKQTETGKDWIRPNRDLTEP